MDMQFSAVIDVISTYLDGIHNSDTNKLSEVFHPEALYACATDGTLLHLTMEEYFPLVDKRPSPASRPGQRQRDRILSVEFAGPVTAFARLECAVGQKFFTDLLTLVFVNQKWKIISKVFHYDLESEV